MIYVAGMLPVLVGLGLLVVDGARLFNLQTLLQKGADSLALTGAAELDGRLTSITRANLAIANLVDNKDRFGAGGVADIVPDPGAIGSGVRFLTGLPADDGTPIDASLVTNDPLLARYVEVTVTPVNMNTIFPVTFLSPGGSNVAQTQASAVAGFNGVLCDFTPVYICNPFEGTGFSILDVITTPSLKRRLINLKQQGGTGSQNSPGNYGLLQPPFGSPGADALRDMIAMSKPPICFLQNGVDLRPGFVATVRDAVNVRFDLYGGPMNANKNDVRFRPARNVRKGYTGPDCNSSLDSATPPTNQKLGRDNCFALGNCPHMSGRMGDGNWDFDAYWAANFGHLGIPVPTDSNGTPYQCGATGLPCANPPSRNDIYRYEIDNSLLLSPSTGGEVGEPQCSASPTDDDPDRRMLFGAVINCIAVQLAGGSSGPYPVEAFVKFFITEAMETGPDQDIYVEMVDVFEPGSGGGIVRDDVQLYR